MKWLRNRLHFNKQSWFAQSSLYFILFFQDIPINQLWHCPKFIILKNNLPQKVKPALEKCLHKKIFERKNNFRNDFLERKIILHAFFWPMKNGWQSSQQFETIVNRPMILLVKTYDFYLKKFKSMFLRTIPAKLIQEIWLVLRNLLFF